MEAKTFIIASGEVNEHDLELATNFLSRIGMYAITLDEEGYEKLLGIGSKGKLNESMSTSKKDVVAPFELESFSDSSSFIVREHFELFREIITPEVDKKTMAKAFNYCIDQRSRKWSYETRNYELSSEHPERPPQLVVKSREELGVAPYVGSQTSYRSNQLGQYAIQIAGFVELGRSLMQQQAKTEAFISKFSGFIDIQII